MPEATRAGSGAVDPVRRDASGKVTGAARYIADLRLPGMLTARLVRSTRPAALLRRVDTTAAARLDGVVATLTGADLVTEGVHPYYGIVWDDQPILAIDRVRFVGEPVAAVAALDTATADAGCARVRVDYDDLPAVTDALEALGAHAPLVHASTEAEGPRNLCAAYRFVCGDVERGLREAPIVVEETYVSPATQHAHLEPHGVVATWEGPERLVVHTSTQNPFELRRQLARIFGLPEDRVSIHVPYVGGAYGAKTNARLEPIAALLARRSGRPVRLVLRRDEVFVTVTKHAAHVTIASGVQHDGRLTARRVRIVWDTGAYADAGPLVAKKGGSAGCGPYRIPHALVESLCVYTHKPPAGAFRGFGVSQVAWAVECHTDELARRVGMDPLAFRLLNLARENEPLPTGDVLDGSRLRECLVRAAEVIGWTDRAPSGARPRGRGIACAIKSTLTPSRSDARLRLHPDGTVTVFAGTIELGQGADTVLAQVAADALGLSPERVRLAERTTDDCPYDQGTFSSRSTFSMGRAIWLAARTLRDEVRTAAAAALEAPPADVVMGEEGVWVTGAPAMRLTFRDLLSRWPGGHRPWVEATTSYTTGPTEVYEGVPPSGESSAFWDVGASAVDVEVDPQTGDVHVSRLVTVADVGRALHRAQCEQQVRGSVVLGLGQTFFEELRYEGGQIVNGSFVDYRLPGVADLPESLEVHLLEQDGAEGVLAAKGVAEIAVPPVSPAIGNAIAQATGMRIRTLPLTRERVLEHCMAAGVGMGP